MIKVIKKVCILLFYALIFSTNCFALERTPIIQQLRNINRLRLIDRLADGAGVPSWAKHVVPDIDYLQEQANQIRQARMKNSINIEAQPQDITELEKNNQLPSFENNTVVAFCISFSRMANNATLSVIGNTLILLGRGVEAISPWSGLDEEAMAAREKTRVLYDIPKRLMPDKRIYNDSWLTSLGKYLLSKYDIINNRINAQRQEYIAKNPSQLADFIGGIGSLVGLVLVIMFIYKPILELLWKQSRKIIPKLGNMKSNVINIFYHTSPPPHTEQREAPPQPPRQSEAIKLVNLGLAAIGRKTQRTNLYLTPNREAARHNAERPFLRQLADKYTDTAVRKVLAKHFMLYKECCLFIIFSTVLKKDAELHSLVKSELTTRLTEGLTLEAKEQRKEYMFAFSRGFYEEYQSSHNMERTLNFTFWSVLIIKHPELARKEDLPELLAMSGLGAAYRFVFEAVKEGVHR